MKGRLLILRVKVMNYGRINTDGIYFITLNGYIVKIWNDRKYFRC